MNNLKQFADLPIRLIVGFHLIYGTQDNILSWKRMLEFAAFLDEYNFPYPLISAVLSAYAQFLAGILFIVGWNVKAAGLMMIFNFLVAIIMVHMNDPYPSIYPALSMLAGAIFLLLNGVGKVSVQHFVTKGNKL